MTTQSYADEIYGDGEEVRTPRQAKGGTFAPADINLIKKVLLAVLSDDKNSLTTEEERQASNLIHRLGRIA